VVSETRRGRRRWIVGIAGTLVAVVLVAVIVLRVALRDHVTVLSVDEAVDRYRAQSGSTTVALVAPTSPPVATTAAPTTSSAPPTSAPAATIAAISTTPPTSRPETLVLAITPGVYTYRTVGAESIDVLGGARHEYPPETTITVVRAGCGVHLRWDALDQRRDEWSLCATPSGVELQPDGHQYHEFFGQADGEDIACDRGVVIVPVESTPMPPQMQNCTLGGDVWLPTWEVLEASHRLVDDRAVEVRHVRMTIADDDEYWEHTIVDFYLDRQGLPVEVSADKRSRSPSPIGGVVYGETYTLELASLAPLQ
jgi:hypothetical protein